LETYYIDLHCSSVVPAAICTLRSFCLQLEPALAQCSTNRQMLISSKKMSPENTGKPEDRLDLQSAGIDGGRPEGSCNGRTRTTQAIPIKVSRNLFCWRTVPYPFDLQYDNDTYRRRRVCDG